MKKEPSKISNALNAIGFGCASAVAHALAWLPLWCLYGFADIIFALMFYVVRYRRKMVRKNLTLCFKDKSPEYIRGIERQYYRNFADYIIETVKLLHISDKEIERRMRFNNMEVVHNLIRQGRSMVCYYSHSFNWEWGPSITLHCKDDERERATAFCQIYRPLRNKRFDDLMLKIRSRFGSVSIPKTLTLRKLIEYRRDGVLTVTGFMSDQKPSHGDIVHVVEFLNRPTAVITGTETLARRLGMAAVFWDTRKIKRGHYEIDIHLMAEDASKTEPFELTDMYFRELEKSIRRTPAIWLWSHNRWKNSPATMPAPTDESAKNVKS